MNGNRILKKKFLIEDKEISLYHWIMPNIEKLLNELTLE